MARHTLTVPVVIRADTHVRVIPAGKAVALPLVVEQVSEERRVSGEVMPALFFPSKDVRGIHDRLAAGRHGGDVGHERFEIVDAGFHGDVYPRKRHSVLFETFVDVVADGKAETFFVDGHEFSRRSGEHSFDFGMDAIADEADGIGDAGFGFGFRFEKTLLSRGGFEREAFGFQLFGTLRGKYSFENDGSHILFGLMR